MGDCAAFWEDFDNNTLPGKYDRVQPPLTPQEKAQRADDVRAFQRRIGAKAYQARQARARGRTAEADRLTREIEQETNNLRDAINRLSHVQNDVLARHFPPKNPGDELDFEAFQECLERFASGRIPGHRMDHRVQWIIWIAFADAAIALGITKWRKLKPILVKGTLIEYNGITAEGDIRALRQRIHSGTDADHERELGDLARRYLIAGLPGKTRNIAVCATGPHPADGGRSQVLVAVAEESGCPVEGATVEVTAYPPAIILQSASQVARIKGIPAGGGVYRAELEWPFGGDVIIQATDLDSLQNDYTATFFSQKAPDRKESREMARVFRRPTPGRNR